MLSAFLYLGSISARHMWTDILQKLSKFGGKYMKKINCREANMCIFCKHWLGKNPEIDYRTGECTVSPVKGKCAIDSTEKYHMAGDLCHSFDKSIIYM